MSAKSKSSSRKTKLDPARPFDPVIWKKAERIARDYAIVIQQSEEFGGYFGRGVEFPGVMGDGTSPEACIASVREGLTLATATLLEKGEVPPMPNSATENRDQQVNVRLSRFEKLVLEDAARSRGYRGISDFMRAATLANLQ